MEQNKLAKLGWLNDTDMILLLSGADEILSSFGIFGQYRKTETSKYLGGTTAQSIMPLPWVIAIFDSHIDSSSKNSHKHKDDNN